MLIHACAIWKCLFESVVRICAKKKKSIERTIRTGIRGERDKKRPCEYVQ